MSEADRTITGDAVPADACLVHVGPHKTGTTAIQRALQAAREKLADHGVVVPGDTRHLHEAAMAVIGMTGFWGGPRPDPARWETLCRDVAAAAGRRVVVSSERLANASRETVHRIVDGLGGPRVHVVVTLRPLVRLLPSQWQQYASEVVRCSYHEWLDAMLNRPPYREPTPSFWHRHRHDEVIARWADVVGTANVTAVVVDENDPGMVFRSFEALLDLPDGLLEPDPGGRTVNRSLTLGEIALIWRLTDEFRDHGWESREFEALVRRGAIARLRRDHEPVPGEGRPATPGWAVRRAAEIGAEIADKVEASGVRVVGDLSSLAAWPDGVEDDRAGPEAPMLSPEAAAIAVMGALQAAKRSHRAERAPGPAPRPRRRRRKIDRSVREVDSKMLLKILWRRGRRRLRAVVRR